MYEARQNKEKVSRRIDGKGGMTRQRMKINNFKTLQFDPIYTLLITGANNRAVTQADAQNVVNRIQGATYLDGKGLQGGGYLVIIRTTFRNIQQIRNDVANVNHSVTVKAGYHYYHYH